MSFKGYSTSIRGASHDDSGKPCQDASISIVHDDYAVAVVSDGHGGSRYYRSEIGSKLAVQASIDVITSCMGEGRSDFITGLESDPSKVLKRVTDAVLTRWTDLVMQYDTENPPSEEELSLEDSDGEREVLRAYGATLICGVLSDDVVFGFQIGDGELVAVNDESEESMLMPEDPDCFLNRTSSICSSEASSKFRHFIVCESINDIESDDLRAVRADPRKVSSISVCTDGLSTSFNSDDSFTRYCSAIPAVLASGDVKRLEDNLLLRSRSNTRDDVSLSVVYRSFEVTVGLVAARHNSKVRSIQKSRKNRLKRKDRRCGRR